jgi:excisionase family DNA binding protein
MQGCAGWVYLCAMKSVKDSPTVGGASDGLLNKWQLAVKLGVGKRTVDAWMKQRRLPFIKVGRSVRFLWPDVLEKLEAYRIN